MSNQGKRLTQNGIAPPETEVPKKDQTDLWSYEIVCRTPEEAQWVLQEIEMFLQRFDTVPN